MSDREPRIPPHIFWPGLVIGLICISITAATITVIAAVSDPSFAVEADYYDKALAWDETVAQRERNAALGWSVEIVPGEIDAAGRRALAIEVRDGAGVPVEGAEVAATVFHFANKAGAETFALGPGDEPGMYAAPVAMSRAGLWSVSVVVEAREDKFTSEQTIELEGGSR